MADRRGCVLSRYARPSFRRVALWSVAGLLVCVALAARPTVDAAVVYQASVFASMGEFGSTPAPWMIPHLRRGLWHPIGAVRREAAEGLLVCAERACDDILIAEARRTSDPLVWAIAARRWPEAVPRRDLWEHALAEKLVLTAIGLASALAVEAALRTRPCASNSRERARTRS